MLLSLVTRLEKNLLTVGGRVTHTWENNIQCNRARTPEYVPSRQDGADRACLAFILPLFPETSRLFHKVSLTQIKKIMLKQARSYNKSPAAKYSMPVQSFAVFGIYAVMKQEMYKLMCNFLRIRD